MSKPTITKAVIGPYPQSLFDMMPTVKVDLSDGTKGLELFSFYPDEISFTERELLGLTIDEARTLKFNKD